MHEASTTRSQRLLLAAAAALITALAAYLHAGGMHAVIAWDEANYTAAAQLGFVANAFDANIGDLRHEHAPLMCYAIMASTAIFGGDEWAVRLPAVGISALSCGLLVIVAFDLARNLEFPVARAGRCSERFARGDAHADSPRASRSEQQLARATPETSFTVRFACAVTAGMLMATSPASIEMAGVIQPHSFVVFFLILNIWTLARFLRDQRRLDAIAFGLSLAGQFIAMEYGPIVLGFALIATALARPQVIFGERGDQPLSLIHRVWARFISLPRTIHRDIWFAAAACLIGILLTWPAGILKLGAARNFAYYLLYASHGHPILFRGEIHLHVPKYAYAYWYWIEYPLLLIGMIAGLAAVAWWAIRDRGAVAVTLAVFTFGLALSVHASHIMQLCKSIFMIPPLVLAAPLAIAGICRGIEWRSGPRLAGAAVAGALAIAAIIGGRTMPMSRDADPNHRLVAMCRTIAEQAPANDRVLAQGWPIVRYLLHTKFHRTDIQVHRYDPRNFASDRLGERIAAGEFAWAVTIGPTSAAHRDCPALARLRASWRIVEDASLPEREYRVYHAPFGNDAAIAATQRPGTATTADAREGETP